VERLTSRQRQEGGEVRLRQSHVDLALGLGYSLTPALRAEVGYRYTDFAQHETSREDGNDISFMQSAIAFGFTHRF
jgi:opacity protein-like surface antigen